MFVLIANVKPPSLFWERKSYAIYANIEQWVIVMAYKNISDLVYVQAYSVIEFQQKKTGNLGTLNIILITLFF